MAGAEHNRVGIRFAALRAKFDDIFEAEHNALELAYYQFWRHGESREWNGADVQATPALSRALFDKLHGALFHSYSIALQKINAIDVDGGHDINQDVAAASRAWMAANLSVGQMAAIKDRVSSLLQARGWQVEVD